jgi:hypothetical protein
MRLYIWCFDMNKTNIMSKRFYSLPVVPYLETRGGWRVQMTEDADTIFSFSARPPQPKEEGGAKSWSMDPTQFNVFEIREALFVVRSPEDALRFFETFGPWQIKEHFGTEAREMRFSSVLKQRDFYLDALLTRDPWGGGSRRGTSDQEIRAALQDWYLWQPLPMEMVFQQPPSVVVRCKDIQDAVRASVFLDRLDGSPWRRCAREDCGKVFKLESKRARMYCSTDCAHLQSVRSYNERKRAEAAKPKSLTKVAKRTTGKAGK